MITRCIPSDGPPAAAIEAEKAVLGSILISPQSHEVAKLVVPIVANIDFVDPAHRVVFEHVEMLQRRGQPWDSQILGQRLVAAKAGDVSAWQECGGLAYLSKLVESVANPAHAVYYAEQVREASRKRRLWQVGADLMHRSGNGEATDDILRFAADQLADLDAERESCRFDVLPSSEFASAEFRTDYAISSMLAERQPCIIAGPQKGMKTSIATDMSIALANGGHFLGYFPVHRRYRVVVLSGESGMGTLQETAMRICDAAGCNLADLDNLFWSSHLPRFDNPLHIDAVGRMLDDHKAEVLVVDPVYLCMDGGDAGNLFAQGTLLGRIAEVCQAAGCTLILLHHSRKTGSAEIGEPLQLEHIAWAGFAEFARQWILISRRERYEPGTGEHRLWLNVGGSAGHSGLWAIDIDEGQYDGQTPREWHVNVSRADEARQDAKRRKDHQRAEQQAEKEDDYRRRLLDALRKFPAGETAKVLRTTAGLNPDNFGTALRFLLGEGRAESCQVTKNGKPYDAYKPTGK